jgi:hypothetical protein
MGIVGVEPFFIAMRLQAKEGIIIAAAGINVGHIV